MTKNLLNGLNPQQRLAVETLQGRLLVLAGAGSGKTRVLTLRMVHLIKDWQVSPKAILGLTFTNKAAAEMRHRMAAMIDPALAKQVTLSTFHGFCMQILRQEAHRLGYTGQFTLYDEKDVQRLMTLIARDVLNHEGTLPSLEPTMAAITQAKNRGLRPDQIEGTLWHDDFVRTAYKRLLDSMRAYNAVDFDHLLWLTVELFEKHPDVLDRYQERFRYIMIDEYQDTNPIQYRLADLLASKYQNLCVVGDDDQSIYGWRGADIKNILEFQGATTIKLEQNYRSTNCILKAANAVIGKNTQRYQKVLWSACGDGEKIEVFHAPTEEIEAKAVVARLVRLREIHHLQWKDMAILYRSNALSRQLEIALMQHTWKNEDKWIQGIPYEVIGGTEFYERREVRDLVAYLRMIVNSKDQEAILRVINQPRRGIGEATLDVLTAYHRSHQVPLWDVLQGVSGEAYMTVGIQEQMTPKALSGIQLFVNVIEEARKKFGVSTESDSVHSKTSAPLHETLQWLITALQYERAIDEEVKSVQMRAFKRENVQEFVNMLAEYEQHCQTAGEAPSLHDFLLTTALDENRAQQQRASKNQQEDKVSLLTIHSSKGLEFPACFLVGMEDHIIPHEKSLKETGVEEERRLLYVAITRAMKFLTISMSQQRKRMGKEHSSRPSRFLFDIPKELLNVTDWKTP